MSKFALAEKVKVIEAIAPATGAAALTGDYISFKGSSRIFIVCHITQGNAATVALSIEQAKTAAGGSSKAITEKVQIFANLDTSAGEYLTKKDDAAGFTTDAAVKNKVVVFQVDDDVLDRANDFAYICVKAALSNTANIISALYVVGDLRYGAFEKPDLTA